jgi:hypothetical protein
MNRVGFVAGFWWRGFGMNRAGVCGDYWPGVLNFVGYKNSLSCVAHLKF